MFFSFAHFFFVHTSSDVFSVQVSSSQQQINRIYSLPALSVSMSVLHICIARSVLDYKKKKKHGKGEKGDLVTMEAAHILT